ncbi:MAG: nitroreductase family protein [Pirellulales bacterium]
MSAGVKRAAADHPVLDAIADRWSPYLFEPRAVESEKLASCLEAARWAASSYNEQPWFFLVASREKSEDFAKLLDCLLEANQAWAKNAGVLLLTVVSRSFRRNGTPNRMAEHDLGLAVGNLSIQATALGLVVHPMAGINPSKARQLLAIPDGHDPITALALGYQGHAATGAGGLADRDLSPRTRKPLSEFVFGGSWNKPLN